MVEDVIVTAKSRLAEIAPASSDDVRDAGRPIVAFSDRMARNDRELKTFLYSSLYRSRAVMEVMEKAETVVTDLFDAYFADPAKMPEDWRWGVNTASRQARAVRVSDFISGMTDNYALREHRRLFDRTPDLS